MFHVYVLRCSDDSLSIGHTSDLDARLRAHNIGLEAAHTSERRPVEIVYSETHPTRLAAVRRERQLEGWTREKKEALIRGDFGRLRELSKRRRRSGGQ